MATLPQRFKLLATWCAAGAPSQSRNPAPFYSATASPGYRLRRCRRGDRLRRFLCRRVDGGGDAGNEPVGRQEEEDRKPLVGRGRGRTLQDLFVASSEAARRRRDVDEEEVEEQAAGDCRTAIPNGGGAGGRRFGSGGLQSLLMRRSWRLVLVAIPESEGKIQLGAIAEE